MYSNFGFGFANNYNTTPEAPKNLPELNPNAPSAPSPSNLKIETFKSNGELAIEYRAGTSNGSGFVVDKAYKMARLDLELKMFTEEVTAERKRLDQTEMKFRNILKVCVPDAKVWKVGSYACGVDIHSSDLDFTVRFPEQFGEKEGSRCKLFKLMKLLQEQFRRVYLMDFVGGWVPVMKLKDRESRVDIDVIMESETSKRNTQFLTWYSQMDTRFAPLCRAIKNWAAHTGVENSREGRLNSFSICLMLISYLQQVKVLPCIQEHFEELQGEFEVSDDSRNLKEELEARSESWKFGANTDSLGELFAGFMAYYASFDFKNKWISVRDGKVHAKGEDLGSTLIVIQDPAISWNCAGSLYSPVALERVQLEFQKCLEAIQRTGSIFTRQVSELRRALEKSGKEQDQQKMKWRMEVAQSDNENDRSLFASWNYAHYFWDERNRAKVEFEKRTAKGAPWVIPPTV